MPNPVHFAMLADGITRHNPQCGKDDIEVEYALRTKANPIGVAAYTLRSKLPGELKGRLPTAKQLADIVRMEMEGRKMIESLWLHHL